MKQVLKKSLFFFLTAVVLGLPATQLHATSSIKAAGNNFGNGNILIYERALNATIGITTGHASGSTFTITDETGKVIMSGNIKSDGTFYIATGKFASGIYNFRIGGQMMQQFIIR